MSNVIVYPFGTEGKLPANIGIIDDLVTGGADKALAAQQGVVLKKQIDEKGFAFMQINLSHFMYQTGIIDSTGDWGTNNKNKHFQLPVSAGEVYRIITNTNGTQYAFFPERQVWSSGGTVSYVEGYEGRVVLGGNLTVDITIPEGCTYLYIMKAYSSGATDSTPVSLSRIIPLSNENIEDRLLSIEDVKGELDELSGVEELFDYATAVVSHPNSNLTISKDGKGGFICRNVTSASSSRALIALPSGLQVGKKYRVRFKYAAQLGINDSPWWLNVSDSAGTTLQSNGYGMKNDTPEKAEFVYTCKEGDTWLRLVSSSVASGSTAYIYDLSITEEIKTVKELGSAVEDMQGGSGDFDFVLRQAQYVGQNPTNSPLTLLHFSDIHNDTLAGVKIKEFFTKYSSKIDDMVQTGDVVQLYLASDATGFPWFDEYGIPEALFVIGNHDGSCNSNAHGWKEGNADWDFFGREWDFDTYFANYITTRGITPPEGYDDPTSPYYKALYWHKDYASAKVRVIGIDGMHFNDGVRNTSNDQETWLTAKLAETLDSTNAAYGYSVVFLCHFPLDDYSGDNETWDDSTHKFIYNQNEGGGHVMNRRTGIKVDFHYGTSYTAEKKYALRNRVGTVGSISYTKGDTNPFGEIIKSWKNNGGKYVVWLSGHTHTEYMYYSAKYPDMLIMGLPQAGNTRGTNFNDRSDDSPCHTAANLIVIDTDNKLLKVIRVGGNTLDKWLQSREYICYNYGDKYVNDAR